MKKQKKSAYLQFVNGIKKINLLKGTKYYASYYKLTYKKNYIYNIEELPYKKSTIKLALKRLIMIGYGQQNDDWYYVNIIAMEKIFIRLAQFQKIKTQPTKGIKNKKIIQLYKKETKAFKEYVEFFRKTFFKKRTKQTIDVDNNITLGKSFADYKLLFVDKLIEKDG